MIKNLTPFFLLIFIVFFSCSKTTEPTKLQGVVFGTTYSIIYYDVSKDYKNDIEKLFDSINNSLSTYISDSDISKINKGEEQVEVDYYFKDVFIKSKKIYKETSGYFDPTVGTLVNAWGFGPGKSISNLNQKTIDSLMKYVGFSKVKLINNKVMKQYPEIYLDFNAIAKGYGIDVVSSFLESKGVANYLVEIGGEIRCKGLKTNKKQWNIQIENPNTESSRNAYDIVPVTNISMATSGNYRKFKISDSGEKFVHTINPKTGYAKESNLLAATVIANLDCADVDAYATALMAMGLEKSKDFLSQKPELKVILIYANKLGELKEYRN